MKGRRQSQRPWEAGWALGGLLYSIRFSGSAQGAHCPQYFQQIIFLVPDWTLCLLTLWSPFLGVQICDTAAGICMGTYTYCWDRWHNEKCEEGLNRPLTPVDRENASGMPQEIVMLCQTHWLKVIRKHQGDLHILQHPHGGCCVFQALRCSIRLIFHPEWSLDFTFCLCGLRVIVCSVIWQVNILLWVVTAEENMHIPKNFNYVYI